MKKICIAGVLILFCNDVMTMELRPVDIVKQRGQPAQQRVYDVASRVSLLLTLAPKSWNIQYTRNLLAELSTEVQQISPELALHLRFALAMSYLAAGGTENVTRARDILTQLPPSPILFGDFCQFGFIKLFGNASQLPEESKGLLVKGAQLELRAGMHDHLLVALDQN